MCTRWALAAFGLLMLAVVAGSVFDAPDLQSPATESYSAASAGTSPTRVDYADAGRSSDTGTDGVGIALLVIGAAAIGRIFFGPSTAESEPGDAAALPYRAPISRR